MNTVLQRLAAVGFAAAITVGSAISANATTATYSVLNLSNEGDSIASVYNGTGYAGVYGGTTTDRFNGIFGLEYDFRSLLFLRGGYKTNYDQESLTLGGGLMYAANNLGVGIDYSYVSFENFDAVHMFSFDFKF